MPKVKVLKIQVRRKIKGYDANKKMSGKRHIAVDTQGLSYAVE